MLIIYTKLIIMKATKRKLTYLGKRPSEKQKILAHYAPLHYISPRAYGEMLMKRKRKKKTSC
jgi:hypothetical protein